MTRQQFIDKAVRDSERRLLLPSGWWGTWRDFTNGRVRVHWSSDVWSVRVRSKLISRHDSRASAIGKAKKL